MKFNCPDHKSLAPTIKPGQCLKLAAMKNPAGAQRPAGTDEEGPRTRLPAYQVIVRELLSEIQDGRRAVGDRLLTETEL